MICLRQAFWQEICSVRARENSNDKRQQAKDRKTSIWRDFHILKKNTYKWEKGDTYSFKIKSEASIKYKMQYYLSSKIVLFKKKKYCKLYESEESAVTQWLPGAAGPLTHCYYGNVKVGIW